VTGGELNWQSGRKVSNLCDRSQMRFLKKW
jgi:hypothetical protein